MTRAVGSNLPSQPCIQALKQAVQALLPTIFNSHVQLIQSVGLPTIKGSCASTNFFITQNYQATPILTPSTMS